MRLAFSSEFITPAADLHTPRRCFSTEGGGGGEASTTKITSSHIKSNLFAAPLLTGLLCHHELWGKIKDKCARTTWSFKIMLAQIMPPHEIHMSLLRPFLHVNPSSSFFLFCCLTFLSVFSEQLFASLKRKINCRQTCVRAGPTSSVSKAE